MIGLIRNVAGREALLLLIAALWSVLLVSGCASVTPRPASTVVLEEDPGPAAARPLPGAFTAWIQEAGATGYVNCLVELRSQVDLEALMRSQEARGLTRQQSRRETLSSLEATAREGQRELEPLLERLFAGGEVAYYEKLRFRDRIYVSCKPSALETLRNHLSVAELIPEYDGIREAKKAAGKGFLKKAPPIPPGDSWGVEALSLRRLWEQGIDGRGVVIGILDSGVMGEHLALSTAHRPAEYWFDPASGSPEPVDTGPHGSQVLSCAVGRAVDGRALGAAPGATWVAALANFRNGYNNIYMSLAADWMLFEGQPDVLLGAWGHGKGSCDPRDRPLVEAFRAAGVVPVFAAGNDGPDPASGQTPAALSGLFPLGAGPLSVAATNRNGEIIKQSSRGPNPCGGGSPFPDVAGPGWEVPVPTGGGPHSLTLASGTSMSVGWIGGVVALVLQTAPEMPVWEVEGLIRRTARDMPPEGTDPASGYGRVDPRRAVEAAREWKRLHGGRAPRNRINEMR